MPSKSTSSRGGRGGNAPRGGSGASRGRGHQTHHHSGATHHHQQQHSQKKGTEIPEDVVLTLRLVAFIEELYVKQKEQRKGSQPSEEQKKEKPIIKTRARNQLLHCSQRPRQHDAEQEEKFNKCLRERPGHDLFAHGNYKDIFQEHFGTTCLLCIRNIVNSIAEKSEVNIDKNFINPRHVDNELDNLLLFRTALHEAEKILDDTAQTENTRVVEKLREKNEKFYERLNLKFHSKREIGTWHFLYVCDEDAGVTTDPDRPNLVSEFHTVVDNMLEKLRGEGKDEHLARWRSEVYQHENQEEEKDEDKEHEQEKHEEKPAGINVSIKDHELIRNISKNRDVKDVDADKLQKLVERNRTYGELRHAVNSDHNLLKKLFRKELNCSIITPDLKGEVDLLDVLYHDLKLRDGDVWSVKQKVHDYLRRWPEAALVLEDCSALDELKKLPMFDKGFEGMRDCVRRAAGLGKSKESTSTTAPVTTRKKESTPKGETKNMFSALIDMDE